MLRPIFWLSSGAALIAACSSFAGAGTPPDSVEPDAGRTEPTDATTDGGAPSVYANAVKADAPIAYWRMDVQGGSIVVDETDAGHDLVLTGSGHGFVGGITGATTDFAVSFNGTTTTARASKSADLEFNALHPYSLECWLRMHDTDSGPPFGFAVARSTGVADTRVGYVLYSQRAAVGGPWELSMGRGDGTAFRGVSNPTNLTSADFHHVVTTFDGVRIVVWVDGVPSPPDPDAGVLPDAATTDLTLGGVASEPSSYFDGDIDEVAIYDEVLPTDRIAAHFAARKQ